MFIIAKQDRVIGAFTAIEATHPLSAAPLERLGLRDSHILRGLVRRGVVVEARPREFCLDQAAADRFLTDRRRSALVALGAAALFAFVGLVVAFIQG